MPLAIGLILAASVLLPGRGHAQAEARKFSNDFLNIGVGARAAGMGNAQTGIVNDVTAGYWNPAGLVHVPEEHEIALMHSEQFAGVVKFDYGAFTTELENEARLGLSVIRLGVDDIPNTLNIREGNSFDFSKITSFSVADMAVLLTYAQPVKGVEGLSMGGNVKIIHRGIGEFATAWGFGLDFGVQYHRNGWQLGATVNDLTNTFNAWNFNTETFEQAFIATGNEIPQNSIEITRPAVRLGLGYNFFRNSKVEVLVSADGEFNFDGRRNTVADLGTKASFAPRAGVEVNYKEIVYLRGGMMNLQFVTNENGEEELDLFPTAGVGLVYKSFALDYALSNLNGFNNNLFSHLVSLRISFNQVKL